MGGPEQVFTGELVAEVSATATHPDGRPVTAADLAEVAEVADSEGGEPG